MAMRRWFRPDNTSDLTLSDLAIMNRATRHLVDHHGMSPTIKWLGVVRQTFAPHMTARVLIQAVNEIREEARP